MVEHGSVYDSRESGWQSRLEQVAAQGYDAQAARLIRDRLERLMSDEFLKTPHTDRFIDELSKGIYLGTQILGVPPPKIVRGDGISKSGRKYAAQMTVNGKLPILTLGDPYVNGYLQDAESDLLYLKPRVIGGHETFHIDQLLTDPDQFDGLEKLTEEEWHRHPIDRAAQAFGRFIYILSEKVESSKQSYGLVPMVIGARLK